MIPNAKYLEPPDPRLSTPIYFGRRDVLVETGDSAYVTGEIIRVSRGS